MLADHIPELVRRQLIWLAAVFERDQAQRWILRGGLRARGARHDEGPGAAPDQSRRRSAASRIEQRGKEIGVRIALGATQRNICLFVLSQLARPVGCGLLVGGGLALALGIALLSTPAANQIGSIVRLLDPIAYSGSLLCIVTACVCAALIPALRAGRIDPIATLRQD